MISVKPEILVWARESAALSVEEAARKIFSDGKKLTATEKLRLVESGENTLSRFQLNKMSKAYHQPLLTFYLSQPPRRGERGEDFRTLPRHSIDRKGNAHLNLLMRDVKASQSLVRELLDGEEAEPLPFINSATIAMGVEHVAKEIQETLGFDLSTFRRSRNQPNQVFNYLRSCIQEKGIFVLLLGDLGHPRTNRIPVSVFRGFVMSDDKAPVIVINRNDNVRSQSFTVLHEVAHLWLGNSGISGNTVASNSESETFCSRVAGSILLPPSELRSMSSLNSATLDETRDRVREFADERILTPLMVAYNLKLYDFISLSRWNEFKRKNEEDRIDLIDRGTNSAESEGQGPSYYTVRKHQLGSALVELARRSLEAESLTPSKAGIMLGVNARVVYPLLES